MPPEKKYTRAFIEKEARAIVRWFREDTSRIFLKAFAVHRQYPSEYLSRWAKENEAFGHAMKLVRDICETRAADMLRSATPARSGPLIFLMKNITSFRDQPETAKDDRVNPIKELGASMRKKASLRAPVSLRGGKSPAPPGDAPKVKPAQRPPHWSKGKGES